ncbi:MAG: hypothetical protein ACREAE_06785, partial [Nitrosopumilaceae archaeon]
MIDGLYNGSSVAAASNFVSISGYGDVVAGEGLMWLLCKIPENLPSGVVYEVEITDALITSISDEEIVSSIISDMRINVVSEQEIPENQIEDAISDYFLSGDEQTNETDNAISVEING